MSPESAFDEEVEPEAFPVVPVPPCCVALWLVVDWLVLVLVLLSTLWRPLPMFTLGLTFQVFDVDDEDGVAVEALLEAGLPELVAPGLAESEEPAVALPDGACELTEPEVVLPVELFTVALDEEAVPLDE